MTGGPGGEPGVAVVLVNYCGLEDTVECISSVLGSTYRNWRAYVVDNASPDGSGAALAERYRGDGRVRVVELGENAGFGGANNAAMRMAVGDGFPLIMLLNNDTVVDSRMIEFLVGGLGERSVAAPLMLRYGEPDVVWYAGGRFDWWGVPRHEHGGERLEEVELARRSVGFVTGCCLLWPSSAFLETGGFDEAYFLYWEDADLSLRLRRMGYELAFCPEARLRHKVSASTGGEGSPTSYYYETRNRLYAIGKLGLGARARAWAAMGLVRGLLSRKERYRYTLRAWRDYRAGRMGKLR